MSDPEILFLYLDHNFKTETDTGVGSFENTLVADFIEADIGYPLTTDGGPLIDYHGEETAEIILNDTLTDAGGYPNVSSAYHHDLCPSDPAIISDTAKLSSGEEVSIDDYDILLVSHLWAYNYLITYIADQYPSKTLIAIQEGSMQDVFSYSSKLQLEHRNVLRSVDGYIAENQQYKRYASQFVDDIVYIPLPVPKRQFEGVSERSTKKDTICVGITTWNIDHSNFYTNVLVVDALRDRGYDIHAELVGVQKFQEKMIGDFDELPFVDTVSFIEDGFYETLSKYRFAILLTRCATAGRASAECAGVGVPAIGNQHNDLQKRCFPSLSIKPHRIDEAVELAERLLNDEEFYQRSLNEGQAEVRALQNHDEHIRRLNEFVRTVHTR